MLDHAKRNRRFSIAVLLTAIAVSLFCIAYPFGVILPFRAQRARELAVALAVIQVRNPVTIISVLAAIAALLFYWRAQPGKWRRAFAIVGTLFVAILAVLARVNIYELMFHPESRPTFAAASQTKLDKDEKVIAVKIGDMARAYPIRAISYHHVINDVVDKLAIVATY